MSEHGYLVVRRGVPTSQPAAVGDDVETYELVDPMPPTTSPAAPDRISRDAHAEARQMAPEVRRLAKSKQWATLRIHGCTCQCDAILVTELQTPSGERWALVNRPESIPPSFRRGDHHDEPTAWPLHREPSGAAHVDFARCPRCKLTWCVALTETAVHMLRVRPTYGARFGP